MVQKGIYCQNLFFRIMNTFSFILILTFLYFLGIEKISDGILHLYSLCLIALGFIVGDKIARTLKK
jgi:DNA integrity scanning protein DisA with diadenylate cyclase activity